MQPKKLWHNPYFQIHISVLLWGFTAILGKAITVDALLLVFMRMSLAGVIYIFFPTAMSGLRQMSLKTIAIFASIGIIVCAHWLCFYHSIKCNNSASLSLACLGTAPMFVSWIEPLIMRTRKWSIAELLISIISLVGIILVLMGNKSSSFDLSDHYYIAVFWGLWAALLAAIFATLNKKYLKNDVNALSVGFIELTSGAVLLGCILLTNGRLNELTIVSHSDLFYVFLLSFFCTNIPFVLSLLALRQLSVFATTIAINLEPIYGFLIAGVLFHEFDSFSLSFYLGVLILLASVFIQPIYQSIQKNK